MNIKNSVLELEKALNAPNHKKAMDISERMLDEAKSFLQPHWDIQLSDEQYNDPEMWEWEPVCELSKKIFNLMLDIDRFYSEDDQYDDADNDNFERAKFFIDDFNS